MRTILRIADSARLALDVPVLRPAALLCHWMVAVLAAVSMTGQPAVAQDCSISGDGWDDVQLFRRCLSDGSPEQWTPLMATRCCTTQRD